MFESLYKKVKKESIKVNTIVLLIAILLGIALAIDLRTIQKQSGPAIGRVTYKINEVNRKLGFQSIWDDIEISSEIYNLDTIRTDNLSKIVVTLNDKTEIQLESNSMIVFNTSQNTINLNFIQGKIQLNSLNSNTEKPQSVKVKTGDSELKLDKGTVKLSKTSDSILDVNVLEGKAELKKGDRVEEVQRNEELKIRGEKLKKEKKRIRLVYPSNSQYFLTLRNSQETHFEWDGEEDNYILEIYHVSKTPEKISEKQIAGKRFSAELKPGKYIWKVFDLERKEVQIDNFYIVDDNPVKLFTPAEGAEFNYNSEPPRILISWSKNEFIPLYKLEVSRTMDFSTTEVRFETENESTIIDTLTEGKYFFRIISKTGFPDSMQQVSNIHSFTIGKKDVSLKPPELVTPEKQHKFSVQENLYFAWKPQKEMDLFKIQISQDRNFKSIQNSVETDSNYISWKDKLETGVYFWRVSGRLTAGKSWLDSEIRSFEVKKEKEPEVKVKLLEPRNNAELKEGNIYFSWEAILDKSYILEVAENPEFLNPIKVISTNNSSVSIDSLKPERYYWRVKVPLANDEFINSSPFVFVISFDPTPVIEFPKSPTEVDVISQRKIQFKWKKINRANSYQIEILKGKELIQKAEVFKTDWTIENITNLRAGNYTFKLIANIVQANGEEKQSNPATCQFKIFLSRKIKKSDIKFTTPEDVLVE